MLQNSKNTHFIGLVLLFAIAVGKLYSQDTLVVKPFSSVTCGNARFDQYLPLLKGKKVAVVTNVTGLVGKTSIVDTLLKLKINIKKIFGPEHGFRSDIDAGEKVASSKDKKTGITVVSLYGANKKPTKEQLKDVDVVLYDIQDIGVRFYTYISTMTYVMEACAENKKQFIVLDRPNPNGFYIDGPVMKEEWKSFLGMHNVPVVYGMTCGEYAKMVNEEGWLSNKVKCDLKVVELLNYNRKCSYELPVRPSPNIPNQRAILLYPSLGLFEGTIMSLGRGTQRPFQVLGHPEYKDTNFYFTPMPNAITKEPKYSGKKCNGVDLSRYPDWTVHPKKIELTWLRVMALKLKRPDFFDKNFNYHVGNNELEKQIVSRMTFEDIRKSWEPDIESFKQIRKKYLLYQDF